MKPQDLPDDLMLAFDRQRAATAAQRDVPWEIRAQRLQRLQQLLKTHEADITQAISAEHSTAPVVIAANSFQCPRLRWATIRTTVARLPMNPPEAKPTGLPRTGQSGRGRVDWPVGGGSWGNWSRSR